MCFFFFYWVFVTKVRIDMLNDKPKSSFEVVGKSSMYIFHMHTFFGGCWAASYSKSKQSKQLQ